MFTITANMNIGPDHSQCLFHAGYSYCQGIGRLLVIIKKSFFHFSSMLQAIAIHF